MLEHDPIEKDERYKEIFEQVDKEVKELLEKKGVQKELGYVHIYEGLKKDILKKKYNIDWKTTKEMNPDVLID